MLRKFKLGGVILGALLALVGCQSEKLVNDGGSQQGQQFTLTASRGIQSRTNLGTEKNTLQLRWSAGDKIYVSSKDGKTTGVLTIKEGDENKPSATFSGFVFGHPEDLYYSVYPVPDEDGKIEMTGVVGNEYKIPMVGEISSREVQFVNTCGIGYMPDSDSEDNMDMSLYAGTDENNLISLACIAKINEEKLKSEGVLEFIYTEHPQKSITLSNVAPIDGKFYFPYDLKNNKGKEVHFYKGEGNSITEMSDVKVTIPDDSNVKTFNTGISIYVSKDGEVKVAEKESVDEDGKVSIKQDKPIVVVPEVAEEVTIEMPVNLSENEEKAVVSIEEIKNENATITITSASTSPSEPEGGEGESETVSQIKEMTVILPSSTTAAQVAQQVVIDMPNTTVTIKSDDGKVLKIQEAIATTGDNTFIVGSGVTIQELIAMKGAIEISGIVNAINLGEGHHYGNNKVKVTVKKGGKAPKNLDKTKFEVIDENEGEVPPVVEPEEPDYTQPFDGTVKTFPELQEALKYNGGLVRIGGDFAIEAPLTITGNFELKMQYHTLTVAEGLSGNVKGLITNKGNLSMSIGTFEGPETCPIKYFFWNEAGSSFNLRGVNIHTNGIYGGVLIENGTSKIENFNENTTSSIIASKLAINNGGTVTIEGARIEGNFINNNQGKITIKGGSVKGDLESSSPQGIIELEGVEPNGNGWPNSGQGGGEAVKYITIEDALLAQALYNGSLSNVVEIDETTGYAQIPEDAVAGIEFLELRGMSQPFELDKLNIFTGLTELAVVENTFTSFEVSDLPSTVNRLVIAENNSLTNLTFEANSTINMLEVVANPMLQKLDVTNVTNVKELIVDENETLSEIVLPEDNQIEVLAANRNALTSIDLSECGNSLMVLVLTENQLTSLEAKNFRNLKHIDFYRNRLTEIDFSGCTSLEEFHMEQNPITKANLSGCSSLTSVMCNSGEQNGTLEVLNLSGCSGLTKLTCSGHHLQKLDLKSAANLQNIQCGKQTDSQGKSITIQLMLHPNVVTTWNNRWSKDKFNQPAELVTTSVEQGDGGTGGANFGIEGIY